MKATVRRCVALVGAIGLLAASTAERAKAAEALTCDQECLVAWAGCVVVMQSPGCAAFYDGCMAGCHL